MSFCFFPKRHYFVGSFLFSNFSLSLSLSFVFIFPVSSFPIVSPFLEFFPNWYLSLLFFLKLFSGIFLTYTVLVYFLFLFFFWCSNVNFCLSCFSTFLVSTYFYYYNYYQVVFFYCMLVFILPHPHFICIVWFRVLFMVLLVLYYYVFWPITSKASWAEYLFYVCNSVLVLIKWLIEQKNWKKKTWQIFVRTSNTTL